MTTIAVVGAQWGDEGKGKVVDRIASDADAVVRYGGGANAGHTLVVGNEKTVFHLLPSGALHPRPKLVLGPGMVIDPRVLAEELDQLDERGLDVEGRVVLSDRAHLVLPQHGLVDRLREQGKQAIGTTKRGIGPCYQDRAARRGLRIADLRNPKGFIEKFKRNAEAWVPFVRQRGGDMIDVDAEVRALLELADRLVPLIADSADLLYRMRTKGERILLEGAQGTMLDLEHGTYPFVTSSSVTSAGACTGSGMPPTAIDRVLGITKAYTTRVGDGPFPTELLGAEGDGLREAGGEFGATTGRPRRCGWLDIPVLRYAVRINGMQGLALTKMDVLSGLGDLRICVAYQIDGERSELPPAEDLSRAQPVYETLEGWEDALGDCRAFDELPAAAQAYVERVTELAGCPVDLVSVGPGRRETIGHGDLWSGQ